MVLRPQLTHLFTLLLYSIYSKECFILYFSEAKGNDMVSLLSNCKKHLFHTNQSNLKFKALDKIMTQSWLLTCCSTSTSCAFFRVRKLETSSIAYGSVMLLEQRLHSPETSCSVQNGAVCFRGCSFPLTSSLIRVQTRVQRLHGGKIKKSSGW